jgi:hypothetical protein
MAVTLTTRADGKKIRRWPQDALNAWMQRQSRADLSGSPSDGSVEEVA